MSKDFIWILWIIGYPISVGIGNYLSAKKLEIYKIKPPTRDACYFASFIEFCIWLIIAIKLS